MTFHIGNITIYFVQRFFRFRRKSQLVLLKISFDFAQTLLRIHRMTFSSNICWFFIFVETNPIIKSVEWLQKLCDFEVMSINLCSQCHTNANLYEDIWMTKPHKKPHLLIWAKLSKHPIWPGLLIKLHGNQNKCYVRFFGDRSYAEVPIENCYLFSIQPNPAKLTNAMVQSQMDKGLQVTQIRLSTYNF